MAISDPHIPVSLLSAPGAAQPRACSERGFTLLEIMVALAILGGVIVTALVSISYHLSVMDADMESTLSAMLARSRLAEVRLTKRPDEARGEFEAPYGNFVWAYEGKTGRYSGLWNESITVKKAGSDISVTITTLVPEEKKE